jgi:capsular polysaccharide transport system permease protein
MTTLGRSLLIQRRVFGALLMREILTRYGRHNIGFMWIFVEPMIFTLGITAFWTLTRNVHGSNLPIVPFAITGYSTVLLWRNAANRCTLAIEPNLPLLYHRNVKVLDLLLARSILEIAGATMSFTVLVGAFHMAGVIDLPSDMFTLTVAWLLLAWFAIALGLMVGAISELSESFDRLWHTVTYILFPLSGAALMVDWLPARAREIMLYVPMVHGTEMLRHGYFGQAVRTYEDPLYLTTVNIVMTWAGLLMVKYISKKVEPQ